MSTEGIRASGDGALLSVLVAPRASRSDLAGWDAEGRLRIRIAAPPVGGAANLAMLKLLARRLAVPRASLRVTAGETSRRKTVAVSGLSPEEVGRALGAELR